MMKPFHLWCKLDRLKQVNSSEGNKRTSLIHKDTTTSEQTDKHADQDEEMYTVYEQVTRK